MNLNKFKKVLSTYPTDELKSVLGESLSDMLMEWTPSDKQGLFTKSTLSEMIATIHGVSVLKDSEFRKGFLTRLTKNEVLSFREVLPSKFAKCDDSWRIIDEVAQASWRKSIITDRLLNILEIKEDIFLKEILDENSVEDIVADERFFELLDYQFVIKQRVLTELTNNIPLNRMLVQMPTGTGKTKTTMHTIIHYFNFNLNKSGLVIWLAHTKELLDQAYETFAAVWRHLGKESVTTYKLWDKFELPDDGENLSGFLFGSSQKLISISKSKPDVFARLVQNCRLIIIDEAHKAAAKETKTLINNLMTKTPDTLDRSLIGLTATPGRNIADTTDIQRLVSMFDSKLIGIEPDVLNSVNLSRTKARNAKNDPDIIHYFQSRRVLAKIVREILTYPETLSEQEMRKLKIQATANGYDDYSRAFLETIGRNKSRNLSIIQKLIRLNNENIPTIVFACSVEHGAILSAALTLQGINNACVFGNMPTAMRKQAIQKFKDREDDLNILINYEVLTTGFDATNIRCVFITRPTQSIVLYSQMIGRGLRGPMMGGNETCLLVDIEDNLKKYDESKAFSYFDNYWSFNTTHNQKN
ncbi:MAG: DEAD/DEAH box helicase family protein [Oscillospiraceae bacterium]|nr:DEAD/DEAH box helicase family protein [Oscillospiraceae bacterium]